MSNSPPSSIFQREHLRHAARDGLLIVCFCRHCRHREAYVAADLLAVYGDMPVEQFGSGSCGRCGDRNCVSTHSHFPVVHDIGKLDVIRPVGWQRAWTWRRDLLELPLQKLPDDIDEPKTVTQIELLRQKREPPKFEDWTIPVQRTPPRRR